MPDQEEFIPLPDEKPDYQLMSMQRDMMRMAGELSSIRSKLWLLHVEVGESPDDEAIAEGEKPETLGYAIRATIEGVCRDHLDSAQMALEDAAQASPKSLYREWLTLKGKDRPKP